MPIPGHEVFAGLEPAAVWAHFATLCAIPRASKEEGKLREHLAAWAEQRGLNPAVDAAGNLILRKPAAPGCEAWPGVVLQAHLDMVCQKNSGVAHDFSSDPIVPSLRDGWLCTDETTLGADNGLGVALILAVLEAQHLKHGPLEALLTVDEEAGMGGARGLAAGTLAGRLMLNLDTEDWGEFYLGCAGGLDVDAAESWQPEALPAGWQGLRLELTGLRGGHSGVDIHEERGNAIKLLLRVLQALNAQVDFRLCALNGGTARNALPREAFAVLALPAQEELPAGFIDGFQSLLRAELAGVDEGLRLAVSPVAATHCLPIAAQTRWLCLLHAAPHGVRRMSRQVPGVVEISNNLGMVAVSPDGASCNLMVRSLVDSGARALGDEIVSLFALAGIEAKTSGHYPGWQPNPDSALLALCQRVYRRDFGGEAKVKVVHAGLECGLIGAGHPGMDIVSFGPTIRGAHAPGERVEVASVERTWRLLTAILEETGSAA
jgi:dipeptidase D